MKRIKVAKKIFSLVLILASLMMVPQKAYALEPIEKVDDLITPMYIDIDFFKIGFDVHDNGLMQCHSILWSQTADLISLTVYLQKEVDGGWQIIETYYNTSTTDKCIVTGERWVTKGTYRIVAIGYTYIDGKLTDTDMFISWTDTYY